MIYWKEKKSIEDALSKFDNFKIKLLCFGNVITTSNIKDKEMFVKQSYICNSSVVCIEAV